MTFRKHSPLHDAWHPRIEGVIGTVIDVHPDWFALPTAEHRRRCVNSLAKRIVGEIAGAVKTGELLVGPKPRCPPRPAEACAPSDAAAGDRTAALAEASPGPERPDGGSPPG